MSAVMDLSQYTGRTSPGAAAADLNEPPVPVLTLAQLAEQASSITWLVKHMVPMESLGIVFGASGTFKSFIALDLSLHVAHGMEWLGRRTKPGAVVYIAAEGGAGLWRRVDAWHRQHGLLTKDAQMHVVPVSIDLMLDASRVRTAVEALGVTPALVVVDTVSQTFSGEENSATEISAYLRELGLQFRQVWQCAVLAVHHTGHAATERPRGSSAIRSNVDFMFGVFRDETEMLATLECTKQKDGDVPKGESFSLKVVDLDLDADGEKVTSLVATRVDDATLLQAMDHEADRGRGGRNHLFLDLAVNGAEEKKLRAVFYEAIDGDVESKRKAYYRARRWAIGMGIIEVAEGYILRLTGAPGSTRPGVQP